MLVSYKGKSTLNKAQMHFEIEYVFIVVIALRSSFGDSKPLYETG